MHKASRPPRSINLRKSSELRLDHCKPAAMMDVHTQDSDEPAARPGETGSPGLLDREPCERGTRMESEMVVSGAIVDSWVEPIWSYATIPHGCSSSRAEGSAQRPRHRRGSGLARSRSWLARGSRRESLSRQPRDGDRPPDAQRIHVGEPSPTRPLIPVECVGPRPDRTGLFARFLSHSTLSRSILDHDRLDGRTSCSGCPSSLDHSFD